MGDVVQPKFPKTFSWMGMIILIGDHRIFIQIPINIVCKGSNDNKSALVLVMGDKPFPEQMLLCAI